jgi:hypothetical protein
MSKNISFFGAVKAPVVSIASAVTTMADTVDTLASVGKVQAQNLHATSLLEGHTDLITRFGDDVSTKLADSINFYNSLGV